MWYGFRKRLLFFHYFSLFPLKVLTSFGLITKLSFGNLSLKKQKCNKPIHYVLYRFRLDDMAWEFLSVEKLVKVICSLCGIFSFNICRVKLGELLFTYYGSYKPWIIFRPPAVIPYWLLICIFVRLYQTFCFFLTIPMHT